MSETVTCVRTRWAALMLAAVLVGCGGTSNGDKDAGSGGRGGTSGAGGGAGARSDAGSDARSDAAADARAELDARSDVQSNGEAGSETRPDALSDALPDGIADGAAPDAAADALRDAAAGDAPAPLLDAGPDAGIDAPPLPPESYVASLTGAEEIPAVDTAAAGVATLTYTPATRSLSWTVTHNVTGASAAGIYTGGAGEVGGAPIALTASSPSTGMATLTALQEADLRLGHLYIDVQSAAVPGGEIRGQIMRPGETLWVARLTGTEETPANTIAGTAVFSLIVNAAHTSGHYRLTTSVTPTVGHIHTGIAGVAGDPLITLTFVGTTAEADIALDDATFQALDETRLYTNVHTSDALNGQIRGQILRAGSTLFVSSMTGAQEAPPVASSGTGNASVALDYRSSNVRYAVVTTLAPTLAHIHPGIAGVSNPPVLTFTNLGTSFAGAGALPQAQVSSLLAGRLYTNIHTAAFADGEIRGQLLRPGERLFVASLSGANEVPPLPPSTTMATGAVQLVLDASATSLRYESLVTGLVDATAAQLMNAPAGMAGPQVATLTLIGLNPVGTLAVTATDVANLGASLYYIDIHSTARSAGEIRGQIQPR